MTEDEREAIYDTEIAPALMVLGRRCQEAGLSFLAMAEWAPGKTGRTGCLVAGSGIGIRIADLAMQANGNADSLILAMMKHGQKHGHNSVCLHTLGVEPEPPAQP